MSNSNKNSMQVIKRDGTKEELNISRIRDVINWACNGLDVSSVALESSLKTRLKDGVTTREIQDNLIECAVKMCDVTESDWKFVGGRLSVWSIWKDTKIARGFGYYLTDDNGNDTQDTAYHETVNYQLKQGKYTQQILTYSEAELIEAGNWINPNYDLDYDFAGITMFKKRYLIPNELPQEALLTCALLIATIEKKENRLDFAHRIYQALAQRKISLATPILGNLRVPGGSLASCFITGMNDDLNSIFDEVKNTALISQSGGGVGMNVSRIRAKGSAVMGRKNASGGVLPWIKILNDTAIAVDQGGKRSGAITVSLDIWHLDIPDFLECQTEAGDIRKKAHDIFPQIVVVDEFMRRVENNQDWTFVCPYEVEKVLGVKLYELWGSEFVEAYRQVELATITGELKLFNTENALLLFKQIMKTCLETGLPYITFKDTINRANPNKHMGYIPSTNLCVESYSVVEPGKFAHQCNLTSLNLANIDISENSTELKDMCELSVRILDNTIDLTHSPFQASKNHNDTFRTIGIGSMGLADLLARNKKSYRDLEFIENLFEDIGYYTTNYSMELAKERGSYPAFEGSEWSKGLLINSKDINWILGNASKPERWIKLSQDIVNYGIRNSHITAIAPNTSSSLVQGCTASILPPYDKFHLDKWANGFLPITPPFIKDYFWFYQENKTMNQNIVIEAVSKIQKWTDTGISMELLFNLNDGVYGNNAITAKEIFDTFMNAWKKECKAIYYIRTVQKDDYKELKECVSCAN